MSLDQVYVKDRLIKSQSSSQTNNLINQLKKKYFNLEIKIKITIFINRYWIEQNLRKKDNRLVKQTI
ncbi:hypothetical protein BpHYR1_010049 [Brachionus plicatilis]|uniref:Uncharacterized protein n=1 Tax=Brachionus plicatilis TaxID=10195 RepID=A0A3M7R8Z3_BRAPC|nr:hypothetical protein BpHYR1_010049 [Brachionus plicatilis]